MNKKLISLLLVSTTALVACGGNTEDRIGEYTYISDSKNECSEILYTCGQFEQPFYASDGCGCEQAPEGEEIPGDERSFKHVVSTYLADKVFPTKEETGYEILVDYLYIDGVEEPIEGSSSSMLSYQIWVVIEQYEIIKDEVFQVNKYAGPMVLTIEQTGLSYIIWENQSFDFIAEDVIVSNFTTTASDWILDKSDSPSAEIKAEMQSRVDSEAEGIAGIAKVLYDGEE
jgi:hypothetical protein